MLDGSAVVVDVRPADRVKPPDAAKFAMTALKSAQVSRGWSFRLVHEPEPVLVANVRWLSGYRHPRCLMPEVTRSCSEAFAGDGVVGGGGDGRGPSAVLPVLFHLIWRRQLAADLTAPLGNHLGVEVPDINSVDAEQTRLAEAGLVSVDERNTTCCYANQDEF